MKTEDTTKAYQEAKRIVVKVGTSSLTHETGLVNIRRIEALVKVLADLKNAGKEIVLVSSGAMAIGRGKLGMREKPDDMPTKQATAAIGQGELMHLYDTMFSQYYHVVAQVLLTKDIIDDPKRCSLVQDTFCRLLELGCLPIVNENDTVSVEEIEFGDNDTLSALVAKICHADALVILSDIDGLYDCDPREHADAKLISVVPEITKEIKDFAEGAGSARGTGGMITKIEAAEIVTQHGIPMAIINGDDPTHLYDLLDGYAIGTRFLPQEVK